MRRLLRSTWACLLAVSLTHCGGGGDGNPDGGPAPEDAAADAAEPDGGGSDAGGSDGGSSDAGGLDGGGSDAGGLDGGGSDAGGLDGGSSDGGGSDGGGSDAGGLDGGSPDAAPPGCTDADGDGAGIGADCTVVDCDDTTIDSRPGASELCDGADNDCDGETDESCACPLLTYDCPAGCCPLDSEQVSPSYGRHPDAAVDADGNLYVAYAIPNSTVWESGMSVHTRATSEWTHFTYTSGSIGSQVSVDDDGRVHHLYSGYRRSIYYLYSDDQGQSWTEIPGIPGNLDIGGVCSMALDSSNLPNLYCGLEHSYPDQDKPNYIRWDGSSWLNELLDFHASSYDDAQLQMGYMDRPHIVHTYGPSEVDLHYTHYTGVQWLTEPVPLPDGLTVHPDRNPGFVLDGDDTVHVGFIAVDGSGDYAAWYATRTATGTWDFVEAIPAAELGGTDWGDVHLELRSNGQPVLFTEFGSGARLDASGSWVRYSVDHEVTALALRGGKAYLVFPTDTGSRPLHVDIVEL